MKDKEYISNFRHLYRTLFPIPNPFWRSASRLEWAPTQQPIHCRPPSLAPLLRSPTLLVPFVSGPSLPLPNAAAPEGATPRGLPLFEPPPRAQETDRHSSPGRTSPAPYAVAPRGSWPASRSASGKRPGSTWMAPRPASLSSERAMQLIGDELRSINCGLSWCLCFWSGTSGRIGRHVSLNLNLCEIELSWFPPFWLKQLSCAVLSYI